jgi:RNA polymerase sigma-70 factor (ECF subfamily)
MPPDGIVCRCSMDDLELIRKIGKRDHGAFKSLVDRYQLMVQRVCYRILGHHQDAEDAAQEVFMKIYRNAETFRGGSGASTWIYRITVNIALNHRRRQKWDRFLNILPFSRERKEDAEDRFLADEKERPDLRLEKKERSRMLSEALDNLPERQRTAIILHKFEGLSYQEIAGVLRTSLSSVESLIHRARKNLQKNLAGKLKKF